MSLKNTFRLLYAVVLEGLVSMVIAFIIAVQISPSVWKLAPEFAFDRVQQIMAIDALAMSVWLLLRSTLSALSEWRADLKFEYSMRPILIGDEGSEVLDHAIVMLVVAVIILGSVRVFGVGSHCDFLTAMQDIVFKQGAH